MERIDYPSLAQTQPRVRRLPSPLARWQRRRELHAARAQADARILAGDPPSPQTAWRAAELTTQRNRLAVARSLRHLVRSADARLLPGSTPLNRIAVREQAKALVELASRLEDLDRPIGARGILLLDRLLTDGNGPLYVSYRAVELRDALARYSIALEARS